MRLTKQNVNQLTIPVGDDTAKNIAAQAYKVLVLSGQPALTSFEISKN